MAFLTSGTRNSDAGREDAARVIQRAWRRRRESTLKADVRWEDAAVHARVQTQRMAANEGRNDPRSRWKRAALLASRLQDENKALQDSDDIKGLAAPESAQSKNLETQHWLEVVDSKHRYGSNLKVHLSAYAPNMFDDILQFQYYHRRWLTEDTEDNFFKWLDRGGGKELTLPECSREQLEKERIIYLSAEQRMNYLVKVDEKGLLRWAKNGDLVDTTAGKWQDSGDSSGIVPFEPSTGAPQLVRRTSFETTSPVRGDSKAGDGQYMTHYIDTSRDKNPARRWVKNHLTTQGWLEKLFRRNLRRNTWIYVVDKNFNIFIGIKDTGKFQHSSFLAGGLVLSAGLISVHKGLIHTLSPLSGHYRTKINNFREFVRLLKERGVDMHRAEISKAELALWGIERINQVKKAKRKLKQSARENAQPLTELMKDEEGTRWKRDVLLGRKKTNQEKDAEINSPAQLGLGIKVNEMSASGNGNEPENID